MESSSPSGKISEPPPHRWIPHFIGTTIAVLTLTLPLSVIAYYSSNQKATNIPQRLPYSLNNIRN